MATKEPKGKKGKDGEKRSAKKSEESPADEEKKEESIMNETETSPTEDPTESPRKEPSPEPVYDEPTLAELIIESYEGEKIRGLYEGEAVAHYTGSHVYKGHFMEGLMHGKGTYTWADGVVYEGEFYQNKVTGKGSYRWPDGSTYDGEVVEGKRHGEGAFRYKGNRMSYSGEWCMGKRHGKGRMDYDSEGKSYYDGDWINNVKHGFGARQYPSGNIYQGMWFNNVRHGEGTMKWHDKNQIYSGNWENGIQHGMGQHIWLLKRVSGSQYPLRNMYDGEFVNGLRHGFGTFYYANGAKYEGGWKNNMKHGKGKFTFKNGRIYEGMFERDHIVEYPNFTMDGATTPDITQIRTQTPVPGDNMSVHSNDSRNTMSPNFQLDIDHLLEEFTEFDRDEEAKQALCVIMRNISSLRKIYNFYSAMGYEPSRDNTYVMNKMQFWRFTKDCHFHHDHITLMDLDRLLGHSKPAHEVHSPYDRILQRQFINNLLIIAYHLYHKEHEGTQPVLAWCISRLIQEKILKNACNVKGHFYYESRRAVNALVHLDQSYEIYQAVCVNRKVPPNEPSMKMRQFMYMMKDLKLINSDLSPKALLDIMSCDDPRVSDGEGCCNLELEMTFLEFFEALIGSAEVYVTESVVKDPATPRPSTVLTPEQSMFSIASPSRLASQVGMDDVKSNAHGSPRQGSATPETSSPVRAVSSAALTTKTGEVSGTKHTEAKESTSNVTGGSDNGPSRHESVKDVQPLAEQQKSASFVSNHTNMTDSDGHVLMQSSVSIGGHTIEEQTEADEDGEYKPTVAITDAEGDDDGEELDEATRQFNFWTHQIHIFFVSKFFKAAEKLSHIRQIIEKRRTEEAKEQLQNEQIAMEKAKAAAL